MTRPGAFLPRPAARTFRDRGDAGRALAGLLRDRLPDTAGAPPPLVLGLARGGVPVAWEVAAALRAPLDVFVVRKLGAPRQPELAMGALAGGRVVRNDRVLAELGIDDDVLQSVIDRETAELRRRERTYRGARAPADLHGRMVILVDDGIATGASMLAALRAVQAADPRSVIVAVPVGAPAACRRIGQEADDIVCATMPTPFDAVGQAYLDFEQVGDAAVRDLLATAAAG
ncbi:phosphoribosyltransferase [[Mycobacterium] kokjensenii]|uniref:Phosphoribosyltransferase n=1 Tax=[Mycobacterium] kokjensenii TaxID=3064287 RepID=A0ABM9LDD8_9MYCO|nr:phosphoribosyltransferase [Mycolicibacter sp. MU0083]CAJ1497111.1 phosphoribosyltransferase [Mycolicibacter sp. MU0083]